MDRKKLETIISRLTDSAAKNEAIIQDLTDHAEWIIRQPSVSLLYDQQDADVGFIDEIESAETSDELLVSLHNVSDADCSQIAAIRMAKQGKNFVLEGPPGTGKSQTVTNIIAELLYDGKKVLFVSEKKAAMDVVYHNLEMVGLGDFCLCIHSPEEDRGRVLADINHALYLPASQIRRGTGEEIRKKQEAVKKLDDYQRQLHQINSGVNMSLWQLYEEAALYHGVPDIDYMIPDIRNLSEEDLHKTCDLLAAYADQVAGGVYDYHLNPWYGYIDPDQTVDNRRRLKYTLTRFTRWLDEMSTVTAEIPNLLGLPAVSLSSLKECRRVIDFMAQDTLITEAFFQPEELVRIDDAFKQISLLSSSQGTLEKEIFKNYRMDVLGIDAEDMEQKLLEFGGKMNRLMSPEYKDIINKLRMHRKDGKKTDYRTALRDVRLLVQYQKAQKRFEKADAVVRGRVGSIYEGIESDWDRIRGQRERFQAMLRTGTDFGRFTTLKESRFAGLKRMCVTWSHRLSEMDNLKNGDLGYLRSAFDQDEIPFEEMNIRKLSARLKSCLENFDKLDVWQQMRRIMADLRAHGDLEYLDALIDSGVSEKTFAKCYEKTYIRTWIDDLQHELPALAEFSRSGHERMVKTFRLEDRVQFDLNRKVIAAELSGHRPSLDKTGAGSAVAGFLSEDLKDRSLEETFDEYGHLITEIKPCLMMSPNSVSRYIRPGGIHFDVVIFEEASQITPEEALGCVSRADQIIVVGDPRQMPPSESSESLLDFSARALMQVRLKWHYRSHSEALIAFSNKYFYNGTMATFPTPYGRENSEGVHFTYVPKGQYDRHKKTNLAEAEVVVDKIFEIIEKYPRRSLGVVSFTTEQEEQIRQVLEKRQKKNPEFDKFFESNSVEPFFIKNIESVQGDERDTIIFSVTYGKDKIGNMTRTFGILSTENGERRLNVAVTRAKCMIQVISSVRSEEIRVNGKSAAGVVLLEKYLDYAENGAAVLGVEKPVHYSAHAEQNLEMEVRDYIRDLGFEVDMNYGLSAVKTDLAVRKPGSSDYMLCIEFDGESYHGLGNVRDRDRLRQEIMEKMGWKFTRVWATEWYKNAKKEKARLKKLLNA